MVAAIELAVLPAEAAAIDASLYVLVDQLRATTTIATLFGRGLSRLIAVDDVDRARAFAAEQHALLFGEVGGLAPAGFDFGNSPAEAAAADVAGRTAVLATTNGTRALCALTASGAVAAGALANIAAVTRYAAGYDRVCVVCAGNGAGARFALEDFAAAAAILRAIAAATPGARPGDAARLAMAALDHPGLSLDAMVSSSSHGKATSALGFAADIDFSLRHDTSAAVPTVVACGDGWAELRDGAKAH